ncbi:hypothetical protein [Luteolibacter sp. Populi]|uniref:hypothetical protein n=1 Tax=Luteolibacter sp. Populi TaxID=3230487 RepID=UPI003467DCB3
MKAAPLTATLVLTLLAGSAWLVALPHRQETRAREQTALPAKAPQTLRPEAFPKAADATRRATAPNALDGRVASGIIYENIGKVRDEILSICATGNLVDRSRGLAKLLENYGTDDFDTAAHALLFVGLGPDSPETRTLLAAWVEKEPEIALDRLRNARGEVLPFLIRAWAGSDPEAAMAWIQRHDPTGQTHLSTQVIAVVMKSDPAAARVLLEALPEEEQGRALPSIAPRDLGVREPAKIRAWVDAMPGNLRQEAATLAMQALPGSRIAEKLEWMREYPALASPGPVSRLYETWIRSDETAAIASFEQLEAGPLRDAALNSIQRIYLLLGKERAALEFLERSMPEFDERKLGYWLDSPRNGAPLLALEQVPRLQDENKRKQIYLKLLGNWREQDPHAVKEWMNTHEIPEDVRKAAEER